jgi:hypothetical protein
VSTKRDEGTHEERLGARVQGSSRPWPRVGLITVIGLKRRRRIGAHPLEKNLSPSLRSGRMVDRGREGMGLESKLSIVATTLTPRGEWCGGGGLVLMSAVVSGSKIWVWI